MILRNFSVPLQCLLLFTIVAATGTVLSCKKSGTPAPVINPPVIQPAVDPPTAATIGFFLDDWQARTISITNFKDTTIPASASTILNVNASAILTKIPPAIFGNNANLWMTQMVTEAPLITHVTNLHPHIIRFPGGSISDVFFWNAQKGVAPADAPDSLLQANGTKQPSGFWFGKNPESWTLSVDNYYAMLQQTGNKGLITINYGYARYGKSANPVAAGAHLAADWVRYDNGRTRYWEIGNENFGDWEAGHRINTADNKDGQPAIITGEVYGAHFKVFADSMRKAAAEIGRTIQIGALMTEAPRASWATNTEKTWNTGLLSKTGNSPDYYVVHNYFTPYNTNSNADEVLASAVNEPKKMIDFVQQTLTAGGATIKPVALDEWNIFAVGSRQMVSHVNGMHAVILLGELLKSKYGLSARWDLANGWDNGNDHAMFNNGDEPGGVPKWNPRPVFHHMFFFKKFLGDRAISSSVVSNPAVETSASSFSSGQVGITLVNKSTTPQTVQVNIDNFTTGSRFYWYTLTGGSDNGEFSGKVFVNGKGPDYVSGGPASYADLVPYSASATGGIRVALPARAVVVLLVDKKS
ncbi:MAG: alpha-L-arabinofuranosidase [Gemmatimonadaceae bacterium]|nr:alpha-L-arabinofuranosidase [Chitinophagaceae bacterium]